MQSSKVLVSNLSEISNAKYSVSLADYHTDIKQNWHSHQEFILAMVLRGNVREQVKCRDVLIDAFDVGVKSPEVLHTDYFCPKGVRVIRLTLAPDFVSELQSRALLNDGWHWFKGSSAVRHFLRIGQSLLSKNTEIEDDIHELLASFLPEEAISQNVPTWLKIARKQIDATFADGVRLSRVAFDADVHPVYFARKFKQFFGCNVGAYIRKKQFEQVRSLLISNKLNLAQIACEAGFTDQSHLTRTLVKEFNITPANLRRLLK